MIIYSDAVTPSIIAVRASFKVCSIDRLTVFSTEPDGKAQVIHKLSTVCWLNLLTSAKAISLLVYSYLNV